MKMFGRQYSYYYGYGGVMSAIAIALLVAIILAVVLYFTFLSKKNEGKFTGVKGKIYDFFNFNRFYAEDVLKLLYLMGAAIMTVLGVVSLFANFVAGLIMLVVGNVFLRVVYELIMMFIIMCRKTVSMDKKLDKITKFYGDDFDGGAWDEEECDCGQCCEGDEDCGDGCCSCEGCGDGCGDDCECGDDCDCGDGEKSEEQAAGEINASER